MENNSEQLLLQGQQLREQGKTFEALDFLNRALDAFAKEKNYSRFAHTLLDMGICWQHLHQFHNNDMAFATLHKKTSEAMLEVLTSHNIIDELDGAYYMNAKSAMIFGDYKKAGEFFQKAIEALPAEKNAQRGDWQTSLGKAIYFSGEKEQGLSQILGGIEIIEKHFSEVDDYTAKVWLSGGFMKLAEVLRLDNPEKSQEHIQKAKEILADDPRFVVRQKQIDLFITSGKTAM